MIAVVAAHSGSILKNARFAQPGMPPGQGATGSVQEPFLTISASINKVWPLPGRVNASIPARARACALRRRDLSRSL